MTFILNLHGRFNIGLESDETRISIVRIGEDTVRGQHSTDLTQSTSADFIQGVLLGLQVGHAGGGWGGE